MLKRGFQFAPGYRLQEFLGRGQFGQVWRATAPGGAGMAAKFIDLSDGQGQKEYDGIKRVKQIRHANLMPITAIWLLDATGKVIEEAPDEAIQTIDLSSIDQGGSGILTREIEPSWLVVAMLLGGKSLQQRLRECVKDGLPGIPPKELISYMDESAKGIDFLNAPQHDLGEGPIAIQHSDIKPANIVLIGSSAVVCDFGLARILSRNQVTATSAAGTPAYMAPEAISGKPCRTSDQYGLAVTYYHLRTGTLPVNDGSLWEVLDAHRQGKLKLGLVPEAEQEVLRKATDLDWEKRFDSCVEMVESLREALRAGGHTKPGFVPKSLAIPVGSAEAPTKELDGDPTATLDLSFTEASAGQTATAEASTGAGLAETQPVFQGEQSTKKDGFLQESLPALDEKAVIGGSTAAPTLAESIKRNPKWIAGAGAGGAVLVLVLLLVVMRPGSDNGSSASNPDVDPRRSPVVDPENGRTVAPVDNVDADALLAEALQLVDTQPQEASTKFRAALAADPGLQPQVTQLSGHQGFVMQMAETPNGTRLVSQADGAVPLLWDLRALSRDPVPLPGHQTLINDFAISRDGVRLITAGFDNIARVWDLSSANVDESMLELRGHNSSIEAVAWRGDQPVAASASNDLNLGIWKIGAPTSDQPNGTVETNRQVAVGESLLALAGDASGRWLAARTQGSDPISPKVDVLVYRWDDLVDTKGSPKPIRLGTPNARVIAVLSSQPMVATGDVGGAVSLYEIADDGSASLRTRTDGHKADVEAMRVVSSSNVDFIVSGAADGTVCRWKFGATSDSSCRHFSALGISAVDVSPDGRWVAAGANDGTVWLWDTNTTNEAEGACRLTTGSGSVDSVVLNTALNLLIAGCDDGVIRVWDLRFVKLLLMDSPTAPPSAIENTIEIKSTPVT